MDGELHFLPKPLLLVFLCCIYEDGCCQRRTQVNPGFNTGALPSLICQKKGPLRANVLPCALLGLSAGVHGELIRHSGLNKEDRGSESWRRGRQ